MRSCPRLCAASLRLIDAGQRDRKDSRTGWTVQAGGNRESYDAVIVSTPSWAAAVLLDQVDAELSDELSAIPYSSSITVNLIFDEAKLGALPDGFGFLVPASEGRAMLACTFVHRKFLGRTPPGKAVLRAFLGGMKNESLLADTDETLVTTVRRELGEILAATALARGVEPEYAQVTRWRRAMAQYAVGHQERSSASRSASPVSRDCAWPATPTTASASPTASASAARRRRNCSRLKFSEPAAQLTIQAL